MREGGGSPVTTRRQFGSVRRLRSGRWQARYRDNSGRMVAAPSTFATKGDASRFLAASQADLARGQYVDPRAGRITLIEWVESWLARPGKRPGTIERDRQGLDVFLPALGAMRLSAITATHIRTAVDRRSQTVAPATVARDFAALRAALNAAVDEDVIPRSPARRVSTQPVAPREARIVTREELQRLANAMGTDRLMPYLAVVLSLRWGEIAGLRVGKLDFARRTVAVVEQRTRGRKGRMVDGQPKTSAGRRTLAVPDWLMTMLADHLAARGVTDADPEALVFVAPNGGPLHYSNWRIRVWVPAVNAVGLDGLHFHDLRKTAATVLLVEGVDVKTAQRRLGHASPQVTLRVYAQATEQADRAAAEKIGTVFRPRSGTDVAHEPTATDG